MIDRYDFDTVQDFKFKTRNHPKPDIEFWNDGNSTAGVWKRPDGDWCKWEDVERLIRKLDIYGNIEIDSPCKIDNYDTIKNIEKLVKEKNNLDGIVIIANWIRLRSSTSLLERIEKWLRIEK